MQIKHDNLTDAVFGKGRRRTENFRWVLSRSHSGLARSYYLSGIDGAP